VTDPLDMRHLCGWCGAEMIGKRSDVIYCSPACKDAEYKAFVKAEIIKSKIGRPPCRQCGAPIPPEAEVRKVFCNSACKDQHRNARVGLRFKAARAGRACAVCGASLDDLRKDSLYCSATCREHAKYQRKKARARTTCGESAAQRNRVT